MGRSASSAEEQLTAPPQTDEVSGRQVCLYTTDLKVHTTSERARAGYTRHVTTPPLETPRLLLRPLELADADQVQKLFPHWEIVKYLNAVVPWPYPADGAHVFFRDFELPAMERGEHWTWTIRLKEQPDQLIGSISLMKGEHENRGFWLGLPWHGQRLMTEASDAVTDFWFDTLRFPVLRVPKAIANTASRRISERQGMRVVAVVERDYVSGRLPAEIWEITAEEWNRRRPVCSLFDR
jgi:RimJ/RimL family protein N-acetyltransferase